VKTIYLLGLLMLAGCGPRPELASPDQCMRREIFKECMAALPKGPERIHNSNDWDEVVEACENVAYYQSKRMPSQIKAECRI
jgi:hypothetical protein